MRPARRNRDPVCWALTLCLAPCEVFLVKSLSLPEEVTTPLLQWNNRGLESKAGSSWGHSRFKPRPPRPLVLLPPTLGGPFALLDPQSAGQASLSPAGRPRLSL